MLSTDKHRVYTGPGDPGNPRNLIDYDFFQVWKVLENGVQSWKSVYYYRNSVIIKFFLNSGAFLFRTVFCTGSHFCPH